MAELLVARHAEDVLRTDILGFAHGSNDTYLTPAGHREAAELAEAVAWCDIRAVHAPPLRRTLTTGRYVCRRAGSPLIIDEAFVGRDMGYFARGGSEGGNKSMARAATQVLHNSQGKAYYVQVPGAESLCSLFERMWTAYEGITETYAGQPGSVMVITQHLAGTLLRGVHDNLSLAETIEYGDLGHTGVARLAPGERSVVIRSQALTL